MLRSTTTTSINTIRRRFASSTTAKTTSTKESRDAAMRDANEKMRAYFVNRPPIEKVLKPKKRFGENPNDSQHLLQGIVGMTFFIVFVSTPFLGRRIAQDEQFRDNYIPKWYDFTIPKPQNPNTKERLHEQLVELQRELHERAIAGEFTPEKLEEMRRHFAGVDPKDDPHGWGKLHPGVDDDEEIEDD